MNEAAAILASLDLFIEQFWNQGGLTDDSRVATEVKPVATINPLTKQGASHSGHCGHPEQQTFTEADSERRNSDAENPDAGLARKVSCLDGHSGQSGNSISNQGVACDHLENVDGQSGQAALEILKEVTSNLISARSQGYEALGSLTDAGPPDPAWWRDHYEERSRHREFCGRRPREEAVLIAWCELQWRWHKIYGEQMPAGICGGCRQPIGVANIILLIDGNRVHREGHKCLMAYGQRWRGAATAGLHGLGLDPPPGFEPP